MLTINLDPIKKFVGNDILESNIGRAKKALKTVLDGDGAGSDFLGWVKLPSAEDNKNIVAECNRIIESWRRKIDVVVVVGIGGSYLGAKAVISALQSNFEIKSDADYPQIVFAGHTMSEDYTSELLKYLETKSFAIIVISKSGTTTEPAIAFRLLKGALEKRYDRSEVKERIVAITDASKGALRTLAVKEGYKTFVIPDNVGGRYSVLTPVGLLPIALAGYDISALLEGARSMQERTAVINDEIDKNPAVLYAAARNALYQLNKKVEILVSYNPKLQFFAEWWKQLYAESEGKDGKGLFPASVSFSTDLHSLGQFIQQGERIMFETNILVSRQNSKVEVTGDSENLDGLNYLSGKRLEEINRMAFLGTMMAHTDGDVPNIVIEIDKLDEKNLGALIYFFELACGISGYILGINPFDQPGVEMYKKNMFTLLKKPGYERN